jgi:hypothetical protein
MIEIYGFQNVRIWVETREGCRSQQVQRIGTDRQLLGRFNVQQTSLFVTILNSHDNL